MPRGTDGRARIRVARLEALRVIVAAVVLALTACTGPSTGAPEPSPTAAAPPPSPLAEHLEDRVEQMTLDELIGQLVVTHVYGADASDVTPEQAHANRRRYGAATPAEVVADLHLGGVILVGRNGPDPELGEVETGNVDDPGAVPELVAGLQAAARGDTGIPLLLAIDQEGGPVVRLGEPLTGWPAAAVLGERDRAELTRRTHAAMGAELHTIGINVDLAPVADVGVERDNPAIGERSFGADPQLVARHVVAAVAGLQDDAGVAAAVKHFPGHGDTTTDSHAQTVVVDHDLDRIRALDLPPFTEAVEAGVDLVMAGHLVYPAVDGRPASISRAWLGDWLRGELGFDGVVVTDSLWMRGVLDHVDEPADAGLAALRAGADLLLMPPDPPATIARIRAAVQDGDLDERRLRDSVRRVLALKQRRGVLDSSDPPRLPDDDLLADHHRLARRVGDGG